MFDARWMFVSSFVYPTLRVLVDSHDHDHQFCGVWRGEAAQGLRLTRAYQLGDSLCPTVRAYVRTYVTVTTRDVGDSTATTATADEPRPNTIRSEYETNKGSRSVAGYSLAYVLLYMYSQ